MLKSKTSEPEEKQAKELDKLVEEGLKEHKEGKCKTIKSLSDLEKNMGETPNLNSESREPALQESFEKEMEKEKQIK